MGHTPTVNLNPTKMNCPSYQTAINYVKCNQPEYDPVSQVAAPEHLFCQDNNIRSSLPPSAFLHDLRAPSRPAYLVYDALVVDTSALVEDQGFKRSRLIIAHQQQPLRTLSRPEGVCCGDCHEESAYTCNACDEAEQIT